MYCTRCGRPLPEDGSPCVCQQEQNGAAQAQANPVPEQPAYPQQPFVAVPPVQQAQPGAYMPPVQQPAAVPPAGTVYMQPGFAVQPPVPVVQDAVRSIAASPVFLAAVILTSATFVLSLVRMLFFPTDLTEVYHSVYSAMYGPAMAERLTELVQRYTLLGTVVGAVPQAFILLGLWLTFSAAKRGKEGPMGTAGLTTLKVVEIVGLVFICIATAFVLLGVVGMIILIASGEDEMIYLGGEYISMGTIALAVCIVALLVCVFLIVYFARVIASLNTARTAAYSGYVQKKASVFVAVMCILAAVYLVIDVFGEFALNGVLGGLAAICSAGANVCFAVTIFKFNATVQALLTPPAPPVQQVPGTWYNS